MKKILIIVLLVVSLAALMLFLLTGSNNSHLLAERNAIPEETKAAVEYCKKLVAFGKTGDFETFQRVFKSIPPEIQRKTWDRLKTLGKLGETKEVKIPEARPSRRYVYFDQANGKILQIILSAANKNMELIRINILDK